MVSEEGREEATLASISTKEDESIRVADARIAYKTFMVGLGNPPPHTFGALPDIEREAWVDVARVMMAEGVLASEGW